MKNIRIVYIFFLLCAIKPVTAIGIGIISPDDTQVVDETEILPIVEPEAQPEIQTDVQTDTQADAQTEDVTEVGTEVIAQEQIPTESTDLDPAQSQLVFDAFLGEFIDQSTLEVADTKTVDSEPVIELAKLPVNQEAPEIIIDPNASHVCSLEYFTVDVTGNPITNARILLSGHHVKNGQLQVLGVPDGFDIAFMQSQSRTVPVLSQDDVDLFISKNFDAQQGSFNTMFAYTDLDAQSTSICQLNLKNQ